MDPRGIALATVASLALVGGVGTSVSQATPRRSEHPSDLATVKPTTDRYVVKLIAKIAPASGTIVVSSNGKWAVTNAGNFDTTYMTQLINVADGTVASLNGTASEEKADGVDNAGIVYGRGFAPETEYGFSWDGHRVTTIPLPASIPHGCKDNKSTHLILQPESVNAFGDVVGAASWSCPLATPPDNTGGAEAISITPQNGIEVSGTYIKNGVTYHPGEGLTIDDDGIISGLVEGPGEPEAEWTNSASAVPHDIAADVGVSAVYPAQTNALWHGGDFVGGSTSAYNGPQSLYVGGANSEKITSIPDTTGVGQDPPPFYVQALSTANLVVGTSTGAAPTAPTSAAVWSVGSSVTPLTSLLETSTKDHLLTAMAIDTKGDIFGTATTSTAAGAQQYLYEAVVSHPAPSVRLKTPKSGKKYKKNAKVKASYTCTAGKGAALKSCKGSVADHHRVSTEKVGKHSFTVVATDTDGQDTKKTVHFRVKK